MNAPLKLVPYNIGNLYKLHTGSTNKYNIREIKTRMQEKHDANCHGIVTLAKTYSYLMATTAICINIIHIGLMAENMKFLSHT